MAPAAGLHTLGTLTKCRRDAAAAVAADPSPSPRSLLPPGTMPPAMLLLGAKAYNLGSYSNRDQVCDTAGAGTMAHCAASVMCRPQNLRHAPAPALSSTAPANPTPQVDLAKDVALLLQAAFTGVAPPPLTMLGDPAAVAELRERPEWEELTACASLDAALAQLAATGLAEQVRRRGAGARQAVGGWAQAQGRRPLCSRREMHRRRRRRRRAPQLDVPSPRPSTPLPACQLYYELFAPETSDEEEEVGAVGVGGAAPAPSMQQQSSLEEGELLPSAARGGTPSPQRAKAQQTPQSRPLAALPAAPPPGVQQVQQQAQQAQQQQQQQQQQAQPLPTAQQPAQPRQQPAPQQQQPQPQAPAKPGQASGSAGAGELTDAMVEDAAEALAALADSPYQAGQAEQRPGSSGLKRRAPSPADQRAAEPRKKRGGARPSKLWCADPADPSRWALILSASALTARMLSLPWTQPADMAAQLFGADWVHAVRQRQQAGTLRAGAGKLRWRAGGCWAGGRGWRVGHAHGTCCAASAPPANTHNPWCACPRCPSTPAVLVDGDKERQVAFALYGPSGDGGRPRPQYLEARWRVAVAGAALWWKGLLGWRSRAAWWLARAPALLPFLTLTPRSLPCAAHAPVLRGARRGRGRRAAAQAAGAGAPAGGATQGGQRGGS